MFSGAEVRFARRKHRLGDIRHRFAYGFDERRPVYRLEVNSFAVAGPTRSGNPSWGSKSPSPSALRLKPGPEIRLGIGPGTSSSLLAVCALEAHQQLARSGSTIH